MTDQIQQVLDLIQERIPMCEKGYLFHLNGVPISKDSYEQNLSRRCKRLGIPKGNNHAFRMALNSELIDLGFSTAERAVLLGHTVRTNEQVYSLAGTHRVRGIGKRLKEKSTYSIYSISA